MITSDVSHLIQKVMDHVRFTFTFDVGTFTKHTKTQEKKIDVNTIKR